jgi:hypothetical protein
MYKMTTYNNNIKKTGIILGSYTIRSYIRTGGMNHIKNEFLGARLSVTKKGSSLDCLVQTANVGEFEIKVIEVSKGKFDLDEVNYDPKSAVTPKMPLYKNSGILSPAPSGSPFSYKITTKNKRIYLEISVNYGVLKGKTRTRISPNKSGVYQIRRINFYDNAGRIWVTIPPPRKKSVSAASSPSGSRKRGSAGKYPP